MHPLQVVFIGMMLLVLAYLGLRVFSWSIRQTDWLVAAVDLVVAKRRGYRLVRMEPEEEEDPFDVLSRQLLGEGAEPAAEDGPESPIAPVKRNGETGENGVATGKTEGNDAFPFPDLFTGLARLVLDKKVGETDALKIAVKVSAGKSPKYLEARSRLHAAIEAVKRERNPDVPQFPALSEEQLAFRKEMGLAQRDGQPV